MAEIIPAIIGQNFTEILSKIKTIADLVNWVHLDIMDGTFTHENSWSTPDDLSFFLSNKIKIEVHLMVSRPGETIKDWAAVVDRIIVHAEVSEHLEEILNFIARGASIEVGLALNLTTPFSKITPFVEQINLIQLMSIAEIGAQGYPFDERVLEKIRLLRQEYPSVKIQVDGGITLDNARSLIEVGADNLVVGSAIWRTPDPIKSLKEFQSLYAPARI